MRAIIEVSMLPNLYRHLQKVAEIMPSPGQTSQMTKQANTSFTGINVAISKFKCFMRNPILIEKILSLRADGLMRPIAGSNGQLYFLANYLRIFEKKICLMEQY